MPNSDILLIMEKHLKFLTHDKKIKKKTNIYELIRLK